MTDEDRPLVHDIFYVNRIISKICGIGLLKNHMPLFQRVLYYLYVSLFYTTAAVFLICEFLIVGDTLADINKLVSLIGLLFTHVIGVMKFLILSCHHNRIQRIMNNLQDKKYLYDPVDAFQPYLLLKKGKQISGIISIMVCIRLKPLPRNNDVDMIGLCSLWGALKSSRALKMAAYRPDEIVDMLLILGENHNNSRAAARLYAERFPDRRHPDHRTIRLTGKARGGHMVRQRRRHEYDEIDARVVFALYTLVGVSAHISSLININRQVKDKRLEGNITCADFMQYYFYIPFTTETKEQCGYAFLFMDISLAIYAWFIAYALGHDGVFVALLNCLRTQLLILGGAFRTIRKRCFKKHNIHEDKLMCYQENHPELENEIYGELNRCIKHLHLLLKLVSKTSNYQTFKNIERRLRENGMLKLNRRNAGRLRQARTILVEEEILERIDEYPETSVRLLERYVKVSKSTINRVLTEQLIRPFHIQPVQELLPHDLAARIAAPISWPPRSPDLNTCDFFIWGDLKQKIYSVSIENEEQLWNRTQNAVQELQNEETLRRVHFNFLCRIDFCINENGGHFEHLIKSQ
ncbi:hypothetical protein NQ318_012258 [Aromia moschata]|uniref:DUF4817 domain-containing protein n=1 Tax=Aromia moschata TaxID=1265417 RepID=A0AAV8X426_9CUCU|nr:hypothetical protein NQ318_012258 [Aromia moschata]